MEADGSCERSGRYVVRAAECRQKIVEHVRVRQIDNLQASAPAVLIAMEQVVLTDR